MWVVVVGQSEQKGGVGIVVGEVAGQGVVLEGWGGMAERHSP